jgi:hypothetical protein
MESKPTLIDALVKAQSEMSHAAFDQTNPHFQSKFASLKSVIDAVKPALNNNGIAFTQEAMQIDGVTYIETVLYGYSDILRTGPVPVVADKQNAQGFGSGMTYAKRYSLSMALGITADTDDDGNAASATPKRKPQSVTKTVLEEEGIKVDEHKRGRYVAEIANAINADDLGGLRELLSELTADSEMKLAVWAELTSPIRSFIKKMESDK